MSEMEVQKAAADSGLLLWIAGAAVTAWNGLLTFVLAGQRTQIADLNKDLKAISSEREDHCVPRPECERTHEALNTRIDRLEDELKSEIKTGVTGIHKRLDKFCGGEK